jgi:ABC-type multidrug transport system fused ATPase/permease subunit
MILVFIAISASSILVLVPPILIKDIIDQALPGKDLAQLALLTLASLGATILTGLIGVGENYLDTWIATHIIYDIKNAMYKHLESMSLAFFTTVKSGDIITRMTSDIGGIQDIFKSTIINFIRNILLLAATAVALVSMNWKLALLGMFIVPFFALPTRKVGKARWKIVSQTQAKLQELNQIIQETLSISGSTLMKIFNRENSELKNPDIIILDEAISSLDSISEYMIQSAMEPLLKGRTSFVIAHRLSTVMAADNILVLEHGHIAESGKHEELLNRGGLYKALYYRQFHNNALYSDV